MHSNKFVYNLNNSLIISDILVIYKTDIYQMQCMYFVGTVDRLPVRWYTLITDLVVISEVLHSVLQDGLHTIYLNRSGDRRHKTPSKYIRKETSVCIYTLHHDFIIPVVQCVLTGRRVIYCLLFSQSD